MTSVALQEHCLDLTTDDDVRGRSPSVDLAVVGKRDEGPTISVLGTFAFRSGDRALALTGGTRKLLALLALRRQPMTRALVAYTLWPDAPEVDASSRLRSALCRLRNSVGDIVDVANLDLQLRPEVGVDIRDSRALVNGLFERPGAALSGRTSSAAVRMLSGDLLPGWDDEWVVADGGEWHQLRLHALEAMAAHLVTEGRCADASLAALAAVRAEPLRESAHGALIKTFLAEGNQTEALDEFNRFRARLGLELGVEPSPRLSGLVVNLGRRSTDA
ncbi:MAG: family transcriptional regulator, regulator of embCAB operon [Actinomycetota bacterium]|nr:family transcriptional regulator, regulator of embCAB operon [Actinomycetota bacterium]